MKLLIFFLFTLFYLGSFAQQSGDTLLHQLLADPTAAEIKAVLTERRQLDLSPKDVVIEDSLILETGNTLYIVSHSVAHKRHYGAVVIPPSGRKAKLPVILFATGGDGMHTQFDITTDFNHKAAQFPRLLGNEPDSDFIIVIPSFRGQELIIGKKRYQSEGDVADAFDGATTDALAFLNVTLKTFKAADKERIGIYGGSRGGTVALLASARDQRIKRVITVAAPADMQGLYKLYPDQFKLLFFNKMLAGSISQTQARKKFIASSPIFFTKEFPPVQLHHDRNDPFVPVAFAEKIAAAIKINRKRVTVYYYNEGIHGFWSDDNFWKRVISMLREL